ncbi:MAG: DUF393 domain-containing protein [Pseudomonadota bacterium]
MSEPSLAASSAYLHAMTRPTEIIYNGSCPICSREIAAYERYASIRNLPLDFTPLDEADLAAHGLSAEDAARRLHIVQDGRLVSGVEAFALLWDAMPRFRWLAQLVRLPVVRPLAGVIYERLLAPLLYALHRRRRVRAARARSGT